jgi:hypothetical protein
MKNCESSGIEKNEVLHKVALKIREEMDVPAEFICDDVEKFVGDLQSYTVLYAFDLRYPDSLTKKIFEMFMKIPVKGFLLTTKNEQGLGAALCERTEDLRDATEDLVACNLDFHSSKKDILEATETLEKLRKQAQEAFEVESEGKVTLKKTIDFCFGRDSGEGVYDSRQDENLVEEITKEYCEELEANELLISVGSSEKVKLHIFEKIDCWGCRDDLGNQMAHTDPGGCLYDEETDFFN